MRYRRAACVMHRDRPARHIPRTAKRRIRRPETRCAGWMSWSTPFVLFGKPVLSRAELLAAGATSKGLTAGVRFGHLQRLRRDHYCLPSLDPAAQTAVRVGGLATCVSALAMNGVFAFDATRSHVHLERSATRLRLPRDRTRRLRARTTPEVVRHWRPLVVPPASAVSVGIIDALIDAFRCEEPVHALASVDNAVHMGLLDAYDLDDLFGALPAALRPWRERVDGRAESGQETVLRELVRDLGFSFDLQVPLPGGQRGDLLVEGCLLLEADSRLAHDGWALHVRDRGRDLMAAQLGYMSLRPAYQHTMFAADQVADAVVGLLRTRGIRSA